MTFRDRSTQTSRRDGERSSADSSFQPEHAGAQRQEREEEAESVDKL